MILSMTGYGKAVAEWDGKKVHVEIKSLNSKTMDISTRLASLYREKDLEIRAEVTEALKHGKVDLSVWIEKASDADDAIPINQSLVEAYYRQIKQISSDTGVPEPCDWWNSLVRMPNVLAKTEVEVLDDDEWTAVHQALRAALDQLVAFRTQEGAALEKQFRQNIRRIGELLDSVEPYEKSRVAKIRERIEGQLQQLLSVDYDHNRLEQELIYYIEKLDITEEKQRLRNHLAYFISTLEGEAGQGKKLGFIAQEMGREINTLGSKSNQAEMQNIVVQMKDELEQIKEQVLNVM